MTSNKVHLSVVVPVYNEEESLQELYMELRGELDRLGKSWEIIIVDDGSKDKTSTILREMRENDSRIFIVQFSDNRGQSAALSAGFATCSGEVIISLDADLQYDPVDIPKLLSALATSDLVCGRRRPRLDPWVRVLLSRVSYLIRRVVLGDRIHDAGCTFRAYRKDCVAYLDLKQGYHRFLPYLIARKGFSVSEVGVQHRARRYGSSKYDNFGRVREALVDLIAIRLNRT